MVRAAFFLTILLAAFTSMTAVAQDASPDDPRLAASMDLMDALNLRASAITVIDAILPAAVDQVRRERPNVNAQVLGEFMAAARDEMVASIDEFVKLNAQIYARHFSVEELHQISDFYRSEIGKKFVAETPAIAVESVPAMRSWSQSAAARAIQAARARFRQKGIDL